MGLNGVGAVGVSALVRMSVGVPIVIMVAVAGGSGVLLNVAVGINVLAGKGFALGVEVGGDACAQAEKVIITSKIKNDARFIIYSPLGANGFRQR